MSNAKHECGFEMLAQLTRDIQPVGANGHGVSDSSSHIHTPLTVDGPHLQGTEQTRLSALLHLLPVQSQRPVT